MAAKKKSESKPAPPTKPASASKPAKAPPKAPAAKPASTTTTAKPAAAKAPVAKSGKAAKSTKASPPAAPILPPVKLDKDAITPNKFFNKTELKEFRQLLLNLRDQIVDDITFLAGDNLNRSARDSSGDLSSYSLHMADQGTDNFDREFALNRVSSEQDILYEIDEALERIRQGTYGICEASDKPIEKARLKIIPHARLSVAAQSEAEKGRRKFRPFGPSLQQL